MTPVADNEYGSVIATPGVIGWDKVRANILERDAAENQQFLDALFHSGIVDIDVNLLAGGEEPYDLDEDFRDCRKLPRPGFLFMRPA